MPCPRCAASEISPDTGTCDLCGYRLDSPVAVERADDALMELVTRQLSHEFDIVDIAGRREGTVVFRALEKNSGRRVVLKVIQRRTDDPDAEIRFRTTMDAFAGLDHPHIVPVLRFGTTDSLLWYATHDTGAVTLRTMLKTDRRLEPRQARRIATQLVSALEYLHRHGLVHGGVRPENVLIDAQGWAWLADPAFARGNPTERPAWMAPEDMTRAERLPTSDQFAIAALVFECVAGEPPREPGEKVAQFRPEVTPAMSDAIARALNAEPWRRFPSCADFLFALEENGAAMRQGRPSGRLSQNVLLIPDWEPPEAAEKPRRHPARFLIPAAVAVLLALGIPSLIRRFETARAPSMAVATSQPLSPMAGTSVPTSTPQAPVPDPRPVRSEPLPPVAAPPRAPAAPSSITRPQPAAAAPVETVAPARLLINASPWGQVYIDDVLVGNTPRTDIELTPGPHVVRVVRAGYVPFSRTVRVESGDTLRITDIVLTPVVP